VTLAPEPDAVIADLLAAAARAIPAPVGGSRIVGIGWATVELERAADELGKALDLAADAWTPADRDQLLGASALLGPPLGPDAGGPRLVLLEPDTEGRLAASLARHGEGVAAVYVVDSPVRLLESERDAAGGSPGGPARSSVAPGPLGPARLLLGGPIWGPHVIVLDAPANPESLPSAGD
jgi:hypothetical protein